MRALKYTARKLFGNYNLYRIYTLNLKNMPPVDFCPYRFSRIVDASELSRAAVSSLRSMGGYAGEQSYGFGAWDGDKLIAVCWFWFGARYTDSDFWPLSNAEAKLIQIVVDEAYRRRGCGHGLISYASREMKTLGFSRLYARIWHSNALSIGAFTGAGWKYIAFVAEVFPFGSKVKWRFVRRVF